MPESRTRPTPRVLCVVDHPYWVSAKIAENIRCRTRKFRVSICSVQTLLKLNPSGTELLSRFDVVHLLTPHLFSRVEHLLDGSVAVAVHVHHLEDSGHQATMERVDAIATGSREWEDAIVATGISPPKVIRIRYGTDPDFFSPPDAVTKASGRRRFGIPHDAMTVGFIGKASSNTSNRKGIDTLSAACRQLTAYVPRFHAFVVGRGWDDVVAELRRDGVSVTHRRFLPCEQDLVTFYRSLDLYLITSRIEGGPVPLLEAMACGVPAVSTPVGLSRELVDHGTNGYLVGFDDPSAVVGSVVDYVTGERQVKFSTAARAKIVNHATWDHSLAQAEELYRTAILVRNGRVAIERRVGIAGQDGFTRRDDDPDSDELVDRFLRKAHVRDALETAKHFQKSKLRMRALALCWRVCRETLTRRPDRTPAAPPMRPETRPRRAA